MKKARAWLDKPGVALRFPRLQERRRHRPKDKSRTGSDPNSGWETLLNKIAPARRFSQACPTATPEGLKREEGRSALMLAQPSMIKRRPGAFDLGPATARSASIRTP